MACRGARLSKPSPRALLVHPPVYDFAFYDLFAHPFGLLRVGSWLREAGYVVELLDALGDRRTREDGPGRGKIERTLQPTPRVLADVPRRYARYGVSAAELRRRMVDFAPDIVLVTSGMTYWYPGVVEVVSVAGEALPGVPVLVGGTYATLMPEHCRSVVPNARVVSGSARNAIAAAIDELGLPVPASELPQNPDPGLGRERGGRLADSAVVRLHEGCPGRCAYCASRGIVPLLERIVATHGSRRLRLHLPNAVHARALTPEIARLMWRAGVVQVRLGIESLDASFHARHDGKLAPGEETDAIPTLREAGFRGGAVGAYVLAGLPGQRAPDVADSVRRLLSLGVEVHVSEYSPVPGSALFAEACRVSRYPLAEEPICHNNSVLPAAGDGFREEDLRRIKRLAARTR